MKKISIRVAVIILFIVSGVIYHFYGKVYEFRFSKTQLQEKLNEKLPYTKTYLFIFQVTLDNPRVNLKNGSNRINAGLDIILNIYENKESLPLGGSLDLSGGIKYVAENGEFFLTDPTIDQLSVQGIPQKYTKKANLFLRKSIGEFYSKHPIYTLKQYDLKQLAAKTILKDVIVENNELVVRLGI